MHLILKTPLQPSEDEGKRIFSEASQAVVAGELSFFEKIHPELEQIITELQLPNPLPKCYYAGDSEEGPVLILEDLSRRGLQMPSLQTDLPESSVQSILRSLAIVQVASCELQLRRQKSMVDLFPFLQVSVSRVV